MHYKLHTPARGSQPSHVLISPAPEMIFALFVMVPICKRTLDVKLTIFAAFDKDFRLRQSSVEKYGCYHKRLSGMHTFDSSELMFHDKISKQTIFIYRQIDTSIKMYVLGVNATLGRWTLSFVKKKLNFNKGRL